MKFSTTAIVGSLVAAASLTTTDAFAPSSIQGRRAQPTNSPIAQSTSTSALFYTVGIVGATGAVGKEIRQCLEDRGKLTVDKLRIFGSSRSAGSVVESSKYGSVEVELFDVEKARECDVVFLAVDGDFALEHAKKISEGDDGAVVIDNSVRRYELELQQILLELSLTDAMVLSFVSLVCIPIRKRYPSCRSRDQRGRNQEIKIDRQSKLHDSDWPHGTLAAYQEVWHEEVYNEYLPSKQWGWTARYG